VPVVSHLFPVSLIVSLQYSLLNALSSGFPVLVPLARFLFALRRGTLMPTL
jgi:hypothetical protein